MKDKFIHLTRPVKLAGNVSRVKLNGDGCVADWQLSDARRAEGDPILNGRRRIVILGTSVRDVHLHANDVVTGNDGIHFKAGGCRFTVPCAEKTLRWGKKACAKQDLSAFAAVPGGRVVESGGLIHSIRQLAGHPRAKQLGCVVHVIDTSRSSPELAAEMARLGVQHTPLGLAPAGINVVLTNGHFPPETLVLRSPAFAPASLNGEASVLKSLLGPNTLALLINSPNSDEAALLAVWWAMVSGVRIYTSLTPSLSMGFRMERLFASDEVTVCSLSEFSEISSALGIDYDGTEKPCNVEKLARAMSGIARARPCGDLAVTMGEAGCMVGDALTGGIYHVGLTPSAREKVCVGLTLHPERLIGSEDRFFAVFGAEHALLRGVPMESSRALHAARCACLELVRSYCRLGNSTRNCFSISHFSNARPIRPVGNVVPDPDWFSVRIFTERFAKSPPETTAN